MVRIIYLLVLSFLLSINVQGQDIFRIKFVYGNEDLSLPLIPSCGIESFSLCFESEINFLTTYDLLFISKFDKQYRKLQFRKDDGNELEMIPQIMGIIDYLDTIPNDTVCFGKETGIRKNGILMEDNQELMTLIRGKIGWKNPE